MNVTTCQRWTHHHPSWRSTSEGGFDANRYRVIDLPEQVARDFVLTHHYAASYPAASRRYGLVTDDRLVGVAVYGVPVAASVLTRPLPSLVPYRESLELARLVLLDEVPANAESWMIARTFRMLRADGVRGVVSFADPVVRTDADNRVIKRGHIGIIYQASNAAYCGRGTARSLTLLPDGTVLNDRAAQKVRAGEQGHEAVERRLVSFGAQPRRTADRAGWLRGALEEIGARRLRHPGNHRYVFRLDRRVPLGMPSEPYPKEVAA